MILRLTNWEGVSDNISTIMKGGISDYMKCNTVLSSYTNHQTIFNNISKSLAYNKILNQALAPMVNICPTTKWFVDVTS